MSILKKVTFLFSLSVIIMIVLSYQTDKLSYEKIELIVKQKYIYTSKELFNLFSQNNYNGLREKWKQFDYKKVDINSIMNNEYETKYTQEISFGVIKILFYKDHYYLYMNYLDDEIILFDKEQDEYYAQKQLVSSLIFVDVFILIILFLFIIKLLLPLKTIGKGLKIFGNGNYDYRINETKNNDEIADIIENFNFMASKLQKLIISRQELLCDISHELRTPISKAKLSIELIEEGKYKQLLKSSIEQMDNLTNELLELEKLNSDSVQFEIKKYYAQTILAEALSRLICEDDDIEVKIVEDFESYVDLKYMGIALKNILDNGLKYRSHGLVYVIVENRCITIENYGSKLEKDLDYYMQTFTQENSARNIKGYGLGLNMVKRILDKHQCSLEYNYKDGKNRFIIQ